MTNLQKTEVQEAIGNYCKAKDISRNELAKQLKDVSAATLSNMVNGKWDNIDEKRWLLVWNMVNPELLQGIIQTGDFKEGLKLAENTIKNKWLSGLVADTGVGKTTLLKAISIRPNVYYYYIDGTVTPKIFLKDLLRSMGVQYEGSLNSMLSRIAEELNTKQSPLLLLDECAKLSDKMLLLLHSLRDKTCNNCGMILAGMPDFKNNLIKQVNKGTTGFAEFYRRINIWHELKGLNVSEIIYVLELKGIADKEAQREFKSYKRFGDLMNEITLYKALNN